MKIDNVSLKDFRNHANTSLSFDPLTIIKGHNAAGKTSLRHALEIALTGRAEFTDRAGRGLADAIRVGAKKAVVQVSIDGLGEITRTISPSSSSLQVDGWTGTSTAQQELLYERLGADADLLAALVNVSEFISLPPKEQKEMLLHLARPEISAGRLMAAVNDWAEEQGGGNLLDELRGLITIPESVDPDWLDQAYKLIFEARKEAKKERDRLAGKLQGMASVSQPGDLPPLDQLEELEKQIAALEVEREKLAEKVAAAQAAESRRESLAKREQDIRKDIEVLMRFLEGAEKNPDELRASRKILDARLDEAFADLSKAQGELRALDASIPPLKNWSGECPLGPSIISCTMTDADRKTLLKDLNARRKKAAEAEKKALETAVAIEDEKESLEDRIETAEQMKRNAERLEGLEKELESIQAELATLPEAVGLDLVREEIASLDERIRNGHELSAKMRMAAEAEDRLRTTQQEAEEAADRADRLELLATLFGPHGLKAKLLSTAMRSIIERAVENLSLITGGLYELDAQVDPDFHLLVNGLELRQLSTSERMRVGIACSEALAHASGLRLLVIDDVEVLDVGNRGLLTSWLMERMTDHDTIIVLSTAEEVQDPGVPGIATYWVSDGGVERVGAVIDA